jgi:hypothetical protein
MSKSLSQLAEELDDTVTLSSSGTYGLGPNVTIGSGYSDPYYGAVPNVTVGLGTTYSNTAITNNGAATGSLGPYTISGGTGITQPWYSTTVSPKIKLDGEGADIEVNGLSLIKTLQEIQSRLNILQPNTALEKEWEELYELGRKYRELEQQIKEKQATWDRLKAMPPPAID